MAYRVVARRTAEAEPPAIQRDPDLLRSFLSDAAHVPGGWASGVAFPRNRAEVPRLIASARRVLAVGAQSSLTGGATPRGDLVLSTRGLTAIGRPADGRVRVEAGVPLAMLQQTLAGQGLYYPPVPTYEGAFVGGTIATNAAGPATFKYGTTRRWVDGLTVVLADGSVLDLQRGEATASPSGTFEIQLPDGSVRTVPVPTYRMPAVPKLSAGYFAAPGMDLIDLFVGSEGTLGVIVEATLRVIARPRLALALVSCDDEAQAIRLTAALRARAAATWEGTDVLDVSAIEYIDARCLALLDDDTFARAAVARPAAAAATLLLVQVELTTDADETLAALADVLEDCGVRTDPVLALPDDARAAAALLELREAVPARVNALVADAKQRVGPAIQKTAGDMIVPFDRVAESLGLYRDVFEARGLPYAVWGHLSDGNLHPNVIPASAADVVAGHDALREIARGVLAMGGAPLAEHGVGRNPLKQAFLTAMYGEAGIDEMRGVKRALDPDGTFARGVLFAATSPEA